MCTSIDIIALIISIISLIASIVISLVTWYITNQRTTAEVEIEIKGMIDEKKDKLEMLPEKDHRIMYFLEEELNAYDKACALYLDKKVDKSRFKKDYKNEINNIFNSEGFIKVGKLNEERCPYNNLKKVYNEWKEEE